MAERKAGDPTPQTGCTHQRQSHPRFPQIVLVCAEPGCPEGTDVTFLSMGVPDDLLPILAGKPWGAVTVVNFDRAPLGQRTIWKPRLP